MFSARFAAMDADYPQPRQAIGPNAVIKAFVQYSAVKAHVICAAFLAAGG